MEAVASSTVSLDRKFHRCVRSHEVITVFDIEEKVVADLLPRGVEINVDGRIFGVKSGDFTREEAKRVVEPLGLVLRWDRGDIRSQGERGPLN